MASRTRQPRARSMGGHYDGANQRLSITFRPSGIQTSPVCAGVAMRAVTFTLQSIVRCGFDTDLAFFKQRPEEAEAPTHSTSLGRVGAPFELACGLIQ